MNEKIKRAKILLVDDEQECHEMFKDFTSERDLKIISAFSRKEATEKIMKTKQENEEPFDLIITDIVMEEEDAGIRLIKDIRKEGIITPLFVVSNIISQFEKQALAAGATKAFSKSIFFSLVNINKALEILDAK